MISFELNVAEKKMIVHGDDTMHKVDGYNLSGDPTQWCINYLKSYMYRSANQLIYSRYNVFKHVGNGEKMEKSNNLLRKCSEIYGYTDWIKQYYDLLFYDLTDIKPNYDSRYFANFHQKRIELMDLLKKITLDKSLYWRSNLVKQAKLNL